MNPPKPTGFLATNFDYYNWPRWKSHTPLVGDDRTIEINAIKIDFNLADNIPEEIIKDILLENDFTDYCGLLFPETKI